MIPRQVPNVKGQEEEIISFVGVDMGGGAWYHGAMSTNHHTAPDEFDPCVCHMSEYRETDTLCPFCEEAAQTMEELSREADQQAFSDAAGQMTQDDWDADNDWLQSAGWGEM